MGKQVLLKNVRFSFVRVFEAENNQDPTRPEYSVVIILPKSEKEQIAKIKKIVKDLCEEFLVKNPAFKGKLPGKFFLPLKDGDSEDNTREEYEGSINFRAKKPEENGRPVIIDAKKNPITSKEDMYSGSWGNASVEFYTYYNPKGGYMGVGVGLRGIQKTRDDESLGGGGGNAMNDFDTEDLGSDDPLNDFNGGTMVDDLPF